MARCYRCNACQSQWSGKPCRRCSYPLEDSRTPEQVAEDETNLLRADAGGM